MISDISRRHVLACLFAALTPHLAGAAVLTVGQGGDHATISAALAIANNVTGDHEIRVRAGTYAERLHIAAPHGGRIELSGGWDGVFVTRDPRPGATLVDAQRQGQVLFVSRTSGHLTVRGFMLVGGLSQNQGAADIRLTGTAELALADCRFADNEVAGTSIGPGALSLTASDQAAFLVAGVSIDGNIVRGSASAGLGVALSGEATGEILDSVVRDNEVIDGDPENPPYGGLFFATQSSSLTLRRVRFLDNLSASAAAPHVTFVANEGEVRVTDSIFAGGNGGGLDLTAFSGGTIAAANLTVADNAGYGLLARGLSDASTVEAVNSVSFGNGGPTTLGDGVSHSNNLIDIDPRFADAEARDYRLLGDSPAIDAGLLEPLAGLGVYDVAGHARVFGPSVDIGAHEQGPSECTPSSAVLCLNNERFQVDVTWTRFNGTLAEAQVVELTDDSGYLWFFSPSNVEMLVKALDACVINDRFWFFAGGLTDVEVSTRVTDTLTGEIRAYRNEAGQAFEAVLDVDAFASCGVAAATEPSASRGRRRSGAVVPTRTQDPAATATTSGAGACVESETTLCLGGGRFAVTAAWRSDTRQGDGNQGVLTGDTGTFWFFSANNLEVVLKVLDACSINQHRWVYAAGLTNVEVVLTVTDTISGETVTYTNPLGASFETITDVEALPCS